MFLLGVLGLLALIGLLLIIAHVRASRKRRAEAQFIPTELDGQPAVTQLVVTQPTQTIPAALDGQRAAHPTLNYPRGTDPPTGPMLREYADQLRSYHKKDSELGPKYYRSQVNGKRVWIAPQLRAPKKR